MPEVYLIGESMADYLEVAVADYTAAHLDVTPQNIMTEEGQKKQIIHEFDDGSIKVITLSDTYFTLTLTWEWMADSEASKLLDLYHGSAKANGMENSFYWDHPLDNETYVVRFMEPLTMQTDAHKPWGKSISSVKLRVEGVAA